MFIFSYWPKTLLGARINVIVSHSPYFYAPTLKFIHCWNSVIFKLAVTPFKTFAGYSIFLSILGPKKSTNQMLAS